MQNLKVKDLALSIGKVTTVSSTDTVKTVLSRLNFDHIISAPVVDANNQIVGFIDVLDLVAYLILVTHRPESSGTSYVSGNITTDDLDMLYKRGADFNLTQLNELIGMKRQPPNLVLGDAPLQSAIDIFKKTGVHRLGVTDAKGTIVSILTQSSLIAYIADHPQILGDKAQTEISNLNFDKHVVSIPSSTRTIDAFIELYEKKLSCLAILDQAGTLVGTISASDLKGLEHHHFPRLMLPVEEFVTQIRSEMQKRAEYLVTVSPNTLLKNAIHRIHTQKVHRAFIVDEHQKPIGIMSLTDIIRHCL